MKKLFLSTLMVATAAFSYSQTPYWSYNFTGGSLQDGVGNDDLTQTGSALTTVADRFSSAGDAVNLNSDVLQGGTVFPTAPGQMGYSFWIKDAVDDANIRIIIDQFDDYGNSIRLQNGKIVVVGRPGYFINPNWNPAFSQTQTLTSTTDVDDGNWHHVVVNAARRSQQEITDYELYIDGTLEASSFANVSLITNQGTAFRPYPTGAPFRVAPDNVNGALQYENIIDDIRYFDQKLNQAQVTALFNATPPAVFYVDQDATGANDGSSWADAYTSLQSAMNAASSTGDQIWVAEGTYKPDASNSAVFFTLNPGVSLYGGFNGTETSLAQRDWNTHETILSGDLNDNDNNSNIAGLYSESTRSDNSHRILFLDGNGSAIDGVTIEGGQANLSSNPAFDRGSAIFVDDDVTSVVLRNSTFRNNASRIGNIWIAYPTNSAAPNSALIESCDFEGNFSRYGAGLSLVLNRTGSTADVDVYNSRFYNNHAGPAAGQTGFAGSSMVLFANQGTINAELVNNTFAYNIDNTTASGVDAATFLMRRLDNSSTDITNLEMYNNIFFNNEDGNGNVNPSGVGGWTFNVFSSITADNNLHDQGELANRTANFIGSANLTAAPNFVDGPNGDLRLTASSWVIDQGDNTKLPAGITKDVGGEDRILNSTIDLGAYEYNPNLCNPPVAINTQPSDESVCAGDDVTLSVAAAGNSVTYQWQLDGVDISGATSSSLTINGVAQGDVGDYTVVASDACNDVTSSVASVSLTEETDITVNFLGVDACEGDDVPFDITGFVDGDNLTYQWFYNGNAINGETGTSYDILDIELTDAGTYSVEATGTCGTDQISTNVTVTESTAITSQPSDETVCAGNNASFSVSADGANLSYQWKLDGTNLTGETSATLDVNGVAAADAGNYTVEVTGDCGSETSNVASLTVNDVTAITAQPSDETLCAGDNASFSVSANGSNLSYQWKLDGTNLSGETSATLDVNGVAAGDAGNYTVDITSDCGTVTSNAAALTLNAATAITLQPTDATVCEGNFVSLSVVASGDNLSFQWNKGGTPLSGETSALYSVSSSATGDAGDYTVTVSGNCGSVTSDVATITVNASPSITTQPTAETVCQGGDVTFSVDATGAGLSYQWLLGGLQISGATSPSIDLTDVALNEGGNYVVEVSGSCGTVFSNAAALTVTPATGIITQPTDETVCEGDAVVINVLATGDNLSYQWNQDGTSIQGATAANYTLLSPTISDAGDYTVEVTGTCGTATSDAATLTVNELPEPTITENMGMLETGAGFDTYQWYLDGVALTGETSATVAVGAPGDYTVEVTLNGCTGESDPYTPMTVGIRDNERSITRLYPNPVANEVNIELAGFSGQVEMTVLDVTGRMVYRTNEGGTLVRLDFSQLTAGTYSLVVRGENGETAVRRLIKN